MTLAGSSRTQIQIGTALVLLMAASRGYHTELLHSLPSASWAVFFLAGVYLNPLWVFPALLGEAMFLDYAAVTWGGAGTFCITPVYTFLLPAYAALWYAGRWLGRSQGDMAGFVGRLIVSVWGGAAVCELLSSGSFYFLSGRFEHPTIGEFVTRIETYFPSSLLALVFYVGLAMMVHVALAMGHRIPSVVARLRTSS